MNILLFVMTMLMLLSTLTYARVANFRSLIGLEKSFVEYMGKIEHKAISYSSEYWYNTLTVNPNSRTTPGGKRDGKAGSRLSFHLLINQVDRDKYPAAYAQTRELFKHLMVHLYGKTQFFEDMIAKRPNFLEELLNEIVSAADQIPKENKITNPNGLSNLPIHDQDLHRVLYLMLNGIPEIISKPGTTETANVPAVKFIVEEGGLDTDDESDAAMESDEKHAPPGYKSIVDYTSANSTLKLRVFLASRPVLMAIYEDADLVERIIEKRQDLYNQLKRQGNSDDATKKSFEDEFRNSFSMMGHAQDYVDILDFTVTKTNPKKYDK